MASKQDGPVGLKSAIFCYKDIDEVDEIDKVWGERFRQLEQETKALSAPQITGYLQEKVSTNPRAYPESTEALLFGILLDPTRGPSLFQHLSAIVNDSYTLCINCLQRVALDKYTKMQESAQGQLVWLMRSLVQLGAPEAESLCQIMLRQIRTGDLSPRNVWLAETVLQMLNENREWLKKQTKLLSVAVFCFLRLLADHAKDPSLTPLRTAEATFCREFLVEHMPDLLVVGRDLVRALHDVKRVPEIEPVWADLCRQASAQGPAASTLGQLLGTPSRSRHLLSRVPPDIQRCLTFLMSNVKMGAQTRYQKWFAQKYFSQPESDGLICDILRYVCCVFHPTNQMLASSLVPRWAVCGWLLKTIKNPAMSAAARHAFVFDWLFFNPKLDTVMNIEPGLLLMLTSVPRYMDITHSLLDALFAGIDAGAEFGFQRTSGQCVGLAFQTLVDKGVTSTLAPLVDHPLIEGVFRDRLKQFYPNLFGPSATPRAAQPPPMPVSPVSPTTAKAPLPPPPHPQPQRELEPPAKPPMQAPMEPPVKMEPSPTLPPVVEHAFAMAVEPETLPTAVKQEPMAPSPVFSAPSPIPAPSCPLPIPDSLKPKMEAHLSELARLVHSCFVFAPAADGSQPLRGPTDRSPDLKRVRDVCEHILSAYESMEVHDHSAVPDELASFVSDALSPEHVQPPASSMESFFGPSSFTNAFIDVLLWHLKRVLADQPQPTAAGATASSSATERVVTVGNKVVVIAGQQEEKMGGFKRRGDKSRQQKDQQQQQQQHTDVVLTTSAKLIVLYQRLRFHDPSFPARVLACCSLRQELVDDHDFISRGHSIPIQTGLVVRPPSPVVLGVTGSGPRFAPDASFPDEYVAAYLEVLKHEAQRVLKAAGPAAALTAQAINGEMLKIFLGDMEAVAREHHAVFSILVPVLCDHLAQFTVGVPDFVRLIVEYSDPAEIFDLASVLVCGRTKLITSPAFTTVVEASFGWESYHEMRLWELIKAESVNWEDMDGFEILKKLSEIKGFVPQDHKAAMSLLCTIAQEHEPKYHTIETLLAMPPSFGFLPSNMLLYSLRVSEATAGHIIRAIKDLASERTQTKLKEAYNSRVEAAIFHLVSLHKSDVDEFHVFDQPDVTKSLHKLREKVPHKEEDISFLLSGDQAEKPDDEPTTVGSKRTRKPKAQEYEPPSDEEYEDEEEEEDSARGRKRAKPSIPVSKSH